MGNTFDKLSHQINHNGSSPRVWGILLHIQHVLDLDTVHPHVCGEYEIATPVSRVSRAVHPHVCGEYSIRLSRFVLIFRFIPTCVGNTAPAMITRPLTAGSSPRVWGILQIKVGSGTAGTVHPHVCGEYLTLIRDGSNFIGSSPRVWGIPGITPHPAHFPWFIPTCVGNTLANRP